MLSRTLSAIAVALGLAAAWPAGAMPEVPPAAAQSDALLPLLAERGLLPVVPMTGDQSLARQARDAASELVLSAMHFIGAPYRRGGDSVEQGFDCSGFTRHVFAHSLGLLLPRRADEQAHVAALAPVSRQDLQPGDLVFFNTLRRAFSHVGIYVGQGRFIHAPRSGAEVRVEDMRAAYWTQRFNGARRAAAAEAGIATRP